jgi:predicted nuclease of predicted toxin-antitoxin system
VPGVRCRPPAGVGRVSLLFDQNLSRRLPGLLSVEFPGSEQVFTAGLATADDQAVWAYAAARGLAVVSKDADFAALSAALGPPPKVIWLRIGNSPTRDAVALLRGRAADVQTFLADPSAALLELP